jgi:hypothetical protein
VLNKELNSDLLKCEICGVTFKDFGNLTSHIKRDHGLTAKEYFDKYVSKDIEHKCIYCDKDTTFISISKGYGTVCEDHRKQYSIDKRKETCLKKYGTPIISQAKEIKEKAKNTYLERYGYTTNLLTPEQQQRKKMLNKERYGDENYFKTSNFKEKAKRTKEERYGNEIFTNRDKYKETCLEKYGEDNPSKNKEIKEKIKETKEERYGNPFFNNSEKGSKTWQAKDEEELKEIREKKKETCLERYGEEVPGRVKEFKDKTKETCLKKYGVDSYSKSKEYADKLSDMIVKQQESVKKTNNEKYGVDYYFQSKEYADNLSKAIQKQLESLKKYNNDKYGVDYFSQTPIFKEKLKNTNTEKYGVPCYFQSKEYADNLSKKVKDLMIDETIPLQEKIAILKAEITKQKINLFNETHNTKINISGVSIVELQTYEYLLTKFQKDDIIPQYFDEERYPFKCDFYIKSKDLFIEINGYWTHGGHPFNEDDNNDLDVLNKWKSLDNGKNQYHISIDVWTKKDPKKLKTAQENNLNYLVIYSCDIDTIRKEIDKNI